MLNKVWIVNLLLSVFIVFVMTKMVDVWVSSKNRGNNHYLREKSKYSKKNTTLSPQRKQGLASFSKIVETNLFSPERREFVPKVEKTVAAEEKSAEQISKKTIKKNINITLFGIIHHENYKAAIVNNRGKSGNKQIVLKIGEMVENYRLHEVKDDSILLISGSELIELPLYNIEKPKRRESIIKQEAPKVVKNIGSDKKRMETVRPQKETNNDEYEYKKTPFGIVKRKKK
jgi:Type II secretion system protein C